MGEQIIVTMTSYGKRLFNVPLVFDTIFAQSVKPDLVVLNLSFDENVPQGIMEYLERRNIEINRVPDTKVYKKLIPTLKEYPGACIISIDDDFLYPAYMISDFLNMHERYPDNPISGNRVIYMGMQCHCGCASLTKSSFFGNYLSQIDDEIIHHCPSDDILYTFFATKNGHPYLRTEEEYFINMKGCYSDSNDSYSDQIGGDIGIMSTYEYLLRRFGPISSSIDLYIHDKHIADVLNSIQKDLLWSTEQRIRSSHAYRLGKTLLAPIKRISK